MFTRRGRALLITLAALLLSALPAAAQSNVAMREAPAGHGLWLPLTLIVVLALLTAPAVLPGTNRRVRRSGNRHFI